MSELVVLINDNNTPVGTEDKYMVHTGQTPLHRGFSLFIINSKQELLLQQRSSKKIAWPNVWSNSVCGHPLPGETTTEAVIRRAAFELNIDLKESDIHTLIPDYRYRYEHHGIVENEICPVNVVFGDFDPKPNPDEVRDFRWVKWVEFIGEVERENSYSEWCQEETKLLSQNPEFNKLLSIHTEVLASM